MPKLCSNEKRSSFFDSQCSYLHFQDELRDVKELRNFSGVFFIREY